MKMQGYSEAQYCLVNIINEREEHPELSEKDLLSYARVNDIFDVFKSSPPASDTGNRKKDVILSYNQAYNKSLKSLEDTYNHLINKVEKKLNAVAIQRESGLDRPALLNRWMELSGARILTETKEQTEARHQKEKDKALHRIDQEVLNLSKELKQLEDDLALKREVFPKEFPYKYFGQDATQIKVISRLLTSPIEVVPGTMVADVEPQPKKLLEPAREVLRRFLATELSLLGQDYSTLLQAGLSQVEIIKRVRTQLEHAVSAGDLNAEAIAQTFPETGKTLEQKIICTHADHNNFKPSEKLQLLDTLVQFINTKKEDPAVTKEWLGNMLKQQLNLELQIGYVEALEKFGGQHFTEEFAQGIQREQALENRIEVLESDIRKSEETLSKAPKATPPPSTAKKTEAPEVFADRPNIKAYLPKYSEKKRPLVNHGKVFSFFENATLKMDPAVRALGLAHKKDTEFYLKNNAMVKRVEPFTREQISAIDKEVRSFKSTKENEREILHDLLQVKIETFTEAKEFKELRAKIGKDIKPSFEQLIGFYVSGELLKAGDQNPLRKLGVDIKEDELKKLQDQIVDYLTLFTQVQHADRTLEIVGRAQASLSADRKSTGLEEGLTQELYSVLTTRREYDPKTDPYAPEFLMIEYKNGFLMRPDQKETLIQMLQGDNAVRQLIMGVESRKYCCRFLLSGLPMVQTWPC